MALKKIFIKNSVKTFIGFFILTDSNVLAQSDSVNVNFETDMTLAMDASNIETYFNNKIIW